MEVPGSPACMRFWPFAVRRAVHKRPDLRTAPPSPATRGGGRVAHFGASAGLCVRSEWRQNKAHHDDRSPPVAAGEVPGVQIQCQYPQGLGRLLQQGGITSKWPFLPFGRAAANLRRKGKARGSSVVAHSLSMSWHQCASQRYGSPTIGPSSLPSLAWLGLAAADRINSRNR